MAALPPISDFTGSGVTEGGFKTALTGLRSFLSGLLGTTGTQASALTTLGTPLNGTVSKSSAYTVVAADRGKVFECTGTFTLSLEAAATLGDGFVFGVKVVSGTVTIDPNGSEQVDGSASKTQTAGVNSLYYCNGTNFVSLGGGSAATSVRVRRLTSGTTYTKPADVQHLRVFVAGATGGRAGWGGAGQGGVGGAGYAEKYYASPAASYSYAIGAAGSSSGTAGGTTTWDAISITSSGGVGSTATGSSGGVASGGDFNANGGAGGNGYADVFGGGGGGGGGGSRAGGGYAGGNGAQDVSSGGGGGGGGGTGSVGANAALSLAGSGGSAATVVSGSAPSHDSWQSPGVTTFRPGFSGAAGAGGVCGAGGSGAVGSFDPPVEGVAIEFAGAACGGSGWNTSSPLAGTPGEIFLWEYI